MSVTEIIHYAIFTAMALVIIVGAIKVATTRSIIHAAFWLFPVFAGVAGFYLFLDAQFLAAIQVLIYIGAILVLIVFAVTLTRNAADTDEAQSNRFVVPVILSALALMIALGGAMLLTRWGTPVVSIDNILLVPGVAVTEVSALGLVLLQQYLLPFEIASVLLLAAMIGAIVMARKERPATNNTEAQASAGHIEAEERELVEA